MSKWGFVSKVLHAKISSCFEDVINISLLKLLQHFADKCWWWWWCKIICMHLKVVCISIDHIVIT